MHFPVVFELGSISIRAHTVFELAAYIVGFQYYLRHRRYFPDRLNYEQKIVIFLGAIIGAAIGSKAIAFLEHPDIIKRPNAIVIYLLANKSIVGGLIGGLFGVELAKKKQGIKHSTGDSFYLPLIIGIAIGRIGCFLSGVEDATHGVATESIFGLDLGDGVIRHPTALYEIIFLLCLGVTIHLVGKRFPLKRGARFQLFMAAYFAWRFGIEWLKPVYVLPVVSLSAIQLASVGMLIYYHNVWLSPSSLLARENT